MKNDHIRINKHILNDLLCHFKSDFTKVISLIEDDEIQIEIIKLLM